MNFSLTMPRKIWFGRGEFARVPSWAAELGSRFLIVTGGSQRERAQQLCDALAAAGLQAWVYDGVTGEPGPQTVHDAAAKAREHRCDVVMGLGGGSAVDAAKAAAAMATNDGSIVDYLEGVGTGAQIVQAPLPFVAIPTTAGTGAEVTKNAVISDAQRGYKSSFRSDRLLAAVAVVDPELCVGTPASVTAVNRAAARGPWRPRMKAAPRMAADAKIGRDTTATASSSAATASAHGRGPAADPTRCTNHRAAAT